MGYYPSKSIYSRLSIYILFFPIAILYSLVVTGCISTSPGIINKFLAELRNTTSEDPRLRIGYVAMCSLRNSSQAAFCTTTVGMSAAPLALTLQVPEALIQYGLNLQQVGFPILLAVGGVMFTLGVVALLMLKITSRSEDDATITPEKLQTLPRRKARWVEITQGFLWLSSAIAFAVAYENTLTLSTLEFLHSLGQSAGGVQIIRGTQIEVMQWLIFSFSFLFSLGAWRIIRQTGSKQGSGFGGPPPGGVAFGGGPSGGTPSGPMMGLQPPMGPF